MSEPPLPLSTATVAQPERAVRPARSSAATSCLIITSRKCPAILLTVRERRTHSIEDDADVFRYFSLVKRTLPTRWHVADHDVEFALQLRQLAQAPEFIVD
ncbi:hypothetical protein [Kinneretia aquatilis]|uniref:hypothetical protein n=1 Tax=Kinneretia aquatilis TaxID=2070761 RepID=UPI001057190D|nr:hypothetical protein [Paucibacter aquatile]